MAKKKDEGEEAHTEEIYTCECLECGHTIETEKHCADVKCPECGGEMRRKERPGPGKSIDVDGEPVPVADLVQAYKAEGEREKKREAREARAKKYGISAKEGGNVTKPTEYANVPDGSFGDPVNYAYPCDAEHARPALTYFNHEGQREAGGYTSEEWATIGKRLTKLLTQHLEAKYEYRDGKLVREEEEKFLSDEEIAKRVEVLENTIRVRVRDADEFQEDTWATIKIGAKDNGIQALIGRLKGKTTTAVRTYIFDKDKWTSERAQAWVKENKKSFEDRFIAPDFAIKSLGETEDAYIIGGYGMVWGNEVQRDLSPWPNQDGTRGEFFTPQTEALNDIPIKVLTFEHDKEKDESGEPIKEALGHTILERDDLYGRWLEAQIEKGKRYAQYVMDLLAKGELYLSSETASHWRDVAANGEIKRWRTAGYTLTTHPMEPRIGTVDALKSYYAGADLAFPSDDGEDGGADAGAFGRDAEVERLKALNETKLALLELEVSR